MQINILIRFLNRILPRIATDLRKRANLRTQCVIQSLLFELHPEVSPSRRLPRLSCRQTACYRDDRGESRREGRSEAHRTITIGVPQRQWLVVEYRS